METRADGGRQEEVEISLTWKNECRSMTRGRARSRRRWVSVYDVDGTAGSREAQSSNDRLEWCGRRRTWSATELHVNGQLSDKLAYLPWAKASGGAGMDFSVCHTVNVQEDDNTKYRGVVGLAVGNATGVSQRIDVTWTRGRYQRRHRGVEHSVNTSAVETPTRWATARCKTWSIELTDPCL